jgi:nitrile hydratase
MTESTDSMPGTIGAMPGYRSHADLGGRDGYGAVVPEPEGENFHAAWEPRALALTLAMGATGLWNLDESRSARETLPDYAALSYYEIWIAALEKLIVAHGLAGVDELSAGRVLRAPRPLARKLRAQDVAATLARGSPTERPAQRPPRFAIGDAVRTRSDGVAHHTRLPGYARGRNGRIEHVRGVHVFADTHAHGAGEDPQWLYTVVFTGNELWGGDARPGTRVSVDAWEPYLEAAP